MALPRGLRLLSAAATFLAVALLVARAGAQEGDRIPGTHGVEAGVQQPSGLYASNILVLYDASALADRNGRHAPTKISLQTIGDAVGVGGTWEVAPIHTFVNARIAIALARSTGESGPPPMSVNRHGISDLYVQPLKLGWRLPQFHLIAGYAFYAPTSRLRPQVDHWTYELSVGSTVFFDARETWRISAVGSYRWNGRDADLDITRGSVLQVQGGVGATVRRFMDVGLASYAVWQVSDDTGADLSQMRVGTRPRTFGLGPEIDLKLPSPPCRIAIRYEHDLITESRSIGQLFFVGATFVLWRPPGAHE
jgi:hypothetical protein